MNRVEYERISPGAASLEWELSPPWSAEHSQEPSTAVHRVLAQLPALALFAVGYLLACRYVRFFNVNAAAPLRFPDSVLLCALLLAPKKKWFWYVLVGLPIRLVNPTAPIWFLTASYLADCLKAASSAYLLRRFIPGSIRLDTMRQFGVYSGIAGVAAPALCAFVGAAIRRGAGFGFWASWYEWFLGSLIAALVLTPTLVYWSLGEWRWIKSQALPFLAFLLALTLTLYLVFIVPRPTYSPVVLYAPVPLLILAAMRFKPIGVSTAISLLALISILGAAKGEGPFFASYSSHGALFLQLFLAVISVPMLFVAILMEERRGFEEDLNHSRIILEENYRRIRDLAGKLLRAQEDERQRIARELHDDIAQRVALLSVSLDELDRQLAPEREKERSLVSELVRDTQGLAADLHNLSHQLHSSALHHMGLVVALKGLCRMMRRQHHVDVELESDNLGELSEEIGICLFRVAQEALNNAIRHGKAKQIHLSVHKHENMVLMKVRDSGIGFDSNLSPSGLGLLSMQERLRLLGGRLMVKSRAGAGTELAAELPLPNSA